MEKIDPQGDHLSLEQFPLGREIMFNGKPYVVQRRTTLASGEAAVVLQGQNEQFLIGADEFLEGVK